MVQVVGGFTLADKPGIGEVRFTPSRLWVVIKGVAWATLAPRVDLDAEGRLSVLLTPTDIDVVPWFYLVSTAAGNWVISPKGTKQLYLKDLVDEHHPGPRTA
jgi:hypothetical protein